VSIIKSPRPRKRVLIGLATLAASLGAVTVGMYRSLDTLRGRPRDRPAA